ncbi:MAG TPA: DUF4442 domain-containing protein [Flavihumibacter sp.]|nr:DUF4442 domain-containing protein [Bacteroidota bacterium]HOA37506.1 DUF4442 domain-containing protein [Flavihumibacter sp.]HPZ87490.1 DUF4442 domain-containing protein [Flavihumibacter sp.]HQD08664.1 DUF4442 domain-containing protein [Flavihumibacter sp.]
MADGVKAFNDLLLHPIKFRLFLLSKIPAAYFSGVRVKSVSAASAEITIPYKWFSTNPFKSTYFACLAMAAEMSTGVLAMAHTYKRNPAVSMLVVGMEAKFTKKATGLTTFRCNDGLAIADAVEKAVTTGEAQTIIARAEGVNDKGEPVASFHITWSFKKKSS